MPSTIKITCGTVDKLICISWILGFCGAQIVSTQVGSNTLDWACEEHDDQYGSRCLEAISRHLPSQNKLRYGCLKIYGKKRSGALLLILWLNRIKIGWPGAGPMESSKRAFSLLNDHPPVFSSRDVREIIKGPNNKMGDGRRQMDMFLFSFGSDVFQFLTYTSVFTIFSFKFNQ